MLGSPYSRSASPFAPTPDPWVGQTPSQGAAGGPVLKKPVASRPPHSVQSIFDPARIFDLARTCHGSRILQDEVGKLLKLGDSVELNKVSNLILGSGQLTELCFDKFGNYFIQALLGAVDAKQLTRFASGLTSEAGPVTFAKLCVHAFGSHVVQVLVGLAKDNRTISSKIVDCMAQNVLFIAGDFLGAICMAQAVKSLPTGNKLLGAIAPLTKELALFRHGHSVLMEAIERGSSQTLGVIEKQLAEHLEEIVASDFGFRVIVHSLELEKLGKVSPKHSRVRMFVRAVQFNQITFRLIDYIIRNFEEHEAVQQELIPRIVDIVQAGHVAPHDG